jgi:hypothetical protein
LPTLARHSSQLTSFFFKSIDRLANVNGKTSNAVEAAAAEAVDDAIFLDVDDDDNKMNKTATMARMIPMLAGEDADAAEFIFFFKPNRK